MKQNKSQNAFLALVRAGLWEKDVLLSQFGDIDFNGVYRLAEEQSVVGLVAAGLELVVDVKIPQEIVLIFLGHALQLEQRNLAMNDFVDKLIVNLRKADVRTVLVKGQGIAQCYERPLWRACGDVDLLLDYSNYKKAKLFLSEIASQNDEEDKIRMHMAMAVDSWTVELHGSLKCGLTGRMDAMIDNLQKKVFENNEIRTWENGDTKVSIPSSDNDILFVFTHILQHFFREGIGLRQICDWCRLLWTYKDSLNRGLLEERVRRAGIATEWKTFAALAVDYLGMPIEAMPLYSNDKRWKKKAKKIIEIIFKMGGFGCNRDYSYYEKYPYAIYKAISLWGHTKDSMNLFTVFPYDSLKVWGNMLRLGFTMAARGE